MSGADTKRPAQLQVNTNGAWKTVARFDAGDEARVQAVQRAARKLHEADHAHTWRIATEDRPPVVLMYMGRSTYGLWMRAEVAP